MLGPNGPIPVDPCGPRYVKAARAAQKQALEAFRTLTTLGRELAAERKKGADQIELAPDLGSPEGEAMEQEAEERMRRRGTKASP